MTDNENGKRSRAPAGWGATVETDSDILEKDDAGGWVSCRLCRKSGKPVVIRSRHPYTAYQWQEHKKCASHTAGVGNDLGASALMRSWVQIREPPSASADAQSSGSAETPIVLEPSTEGRPKKRRTVMCPGIIHCFANLVALFCVYGQYADLNVTITMSENQHFIHAEGCTREAVKKRILSRRYAKSSCEACYNFPLKTRDRLQGRIDKMKNVETVLNICKKVHYSDHDITEMTAFLKTTAASNLTEEKRRLIETVKAHKGYFEWNASNRASLQSLGVAATDAPDAFLSKFGDLYRTSEHFEGGVLIGLVKAVMARADGHVNAKVSEDVIALCQALHCKSPAAYSMMKSNIFGISERHIRRIEARERTSCVLSEEATLTRVNNWAGKLSAAQERSILASLAIDATRVPKREEASFAYRMTVGGVAPNHVLPFDESRKPTESTNLASEIKCYLLTTQNVVEGVSPMCMVAARPQSTNECTEDYNKRTVDTIKSSEHLSLVSVAVDGLSAESGFVRDGLLDFMLGVENTVYFVDPNHVAKAVRSQLVLGTSIVTLGDAVVDPGLFLAAGVKQELYRVDDYASDGLVLELCSEATLGKLEAVMETEEANSVVATGLTLFFLRAFLVAVNSKADISATDRASLLWGLVDRIGRLEVAFKNMVTYNISGSQSQKGYMSGFKAYKEQLDKMLSTQRRTVSSQQAPGRPSASSVSGGRPTGVDIDYDCKGGKSVGAQLAATVLETVNSVSSEVGELLKHFGCATLSPFCRQYSDLKELAAVFFQYMPLAYQRQSRHRNLAAVICPAVVETECVESDPPTDATDSTDDAADALADIVRSLQDNLAIASDEDTITMGEKELPPLIHANEPSPADEGVHCREFYDILRLTKDDLTGVKAFMLARQCLQAVGAKERGRSDMLLKAKSLKGRWYSADGGPSAGIGDGVEGNAGFKLARDDVFRVDGTFVRLLSVYRKSHNKLRMLSAAAGDKGTIVHCSVAKAVFGRYAEDSCSRGRFMKLSGDEFSPTNLVVPRREEYL
eukprot:GHVU01009917.1.p1 GENE.GHVU01009917.1~~GHVU01009917.1.p1  ORF type:complete len:1028 (+),score=110.56 GHVU01009917.1:417-3500(+)